METRARTWAVVALACFAASPASASYFYCPWADAIVRLDFAKDDANVVVAYGLYPRTPNLAVDVKTGRLYDQQIELFFWERYGDFIHEFYFDRKLERLRNVRLNTMTGRRSEQQGYCFKGD